MAHPVQKPIPISLPEYGIWVAESIHDTSFRMGSERHQFHQIYIVQRGQITLEDERLATPITLKGGSLWPIPAGIAHRMDDIAESILLLVSLSDTYLQSSRSRVNLWQGLTALDNPTHGAEPVHFSPMLATLNRILAEQWQQLPGYEIAIAAELDQLLVRLARDPGGTSSDTAPARVRRVIAMLHTRFFEVWDLDKAAQKAHLSRRRFTTIFREETGDSFNTYLTGLRLAHALALLQGGHHSIAGAAFASGIGDVSQFYRVFKRHTGSTPAAWLARHR